MDGMVIGQRAPLVQMIDNLHHPGDGGWAAVLAVQGSTAATTARPSYGRSWGQTSPYWGQL